MPSKCAWNRVIAAQCHWISWISSQPLYQTINPNVFPLKKSSKISWTWTCSQICFPSQESTDNPPAVPGVAAESRPPGHLDLHGSRVFMACMTAGPISPLILLSKASSISSTFEQWPAHFLDSLACVFLWLNSPWQILWNHNKLHIIHPVASCPRRISATCNDSRSAR